MPISKINPDGTVNIYNSKTGVVKNNISPDTLGAISPRLVAEYQGMQAPEKVLARTETEKKLKEMQPGAKPLDDKAESAGRLLTELESQYFGNEGDQPLAYGKYGFGGRVPGIVKGIESEIAPSKDTERLNTFKRTLESKRALLAKAAGDAGNLALQEQILAGRGLPDETSTLGEAMELFRVARNVYGLPESEAMKRVSKITGDKEERAIATQAATLSSKPTDTTQVPDLTAMKAEPGKISVPLSKVLTGLFPGLQATQIPIIKNILAQRGSDVLEKIDKGEHVTADEVLGAGGEMLRNALLGGGVTAGAVGGVISGLTKPGESAGERVKSAALESALSAATGGAIKLGGKVTGLFKPKYGKEVLEEGLNLAKKGEQVRDVAIKTAQEAGRKFKGNKIFKGIETWAEDAKATATSSEASQINSLLRRAKKIYKDKNISPVTAKKRWDTASKGYTASGIAGDTMRAEYHRAIRDVIRKELDKVAPGFESGTQTIRKGLEKEELLEPIRKGLEREGIKKGLKAPAIEFAKGTAKTLGSGAALLGLAKALNIPIFGNQGE